MKRIATYLPVVALAVSFGGLFAASILAAGHFFNLSVPCGDSGGCAVVASDPSSVFLGIPIAFIGIAAYVAIVFLLTRVAAARWARRALVPLTGLGMLISAGLLAYAHFVIGAVCVWCLASGLAMTLLFALSIGMWRAGAAPQPISPGVFLSLTFLAVTALGTELWRMERNISTPPIAIERLARVTAAELLDSENTKGPADARVKVVIFSDLWCSVCRAVHGPLLDFQSEHSRDVQVVFRHRPLTWVRGHETSETAAVLSEIAAERGEFWQFVQQLYREPKELDHGGYLRLMGELGFDEREVEAALASKRSGSSMRVQRDVGMADRLGLRSTPTFVLMIGSDPPVSANHRSLAETLNSPRVQALFH